MSGIRRFPDRKGGGSPSGFRLPVPGQGVDWRMGYMIAAVVFVVGVLLVAFLLSGSRAPRTPQGRTGAAESEPVERTEPSADQPTPAASATADEGTATKAQRRVPPA